jgi:hypothetical protein
MGFETPDYLWETERNFFFMHSHEGDQGLGYGHRILTPHIKDL